MSLPKGLAILFIFSKNLLLVSLIFSIAFFFFILLGLCFMYFCSDLYDFFASADIK